ncbi:hypothetical protein Sm713_44460 [Streptomyces sp. TS71-3]|nr:hypothetical protein Sm713_44460 [Streptomyces sp. TS71-3]
MRAEAAPSRTDRISSPGATGNLRAPTVPPHVFPPVLFLNRPARQACWDGSDGRGTRASHPAARRGRTSERAPDTRAGTGYAHNCCARNAQK